MKTINSRPVFGVLLILFLTTSCLGTSLNTVIQPKNGTGPDDSQIELTATEPIVLTATSTLTPTITPTEEPTETPTITPTPTSTATPTVTPTEKPVVDERIFFDPQSVEDIDKLLESPSPITDPEAFALWQDEYIKLINQKLETYTGPFMQVSFAVIDMGAFTIGINQWVAIASYQFTYIENGTTFTIVNKTFVFKDTHGSNLLLTVTFLPEKIIPFDDFYMKEGLYKPPNKPGTLRLGFLFVDLLRILIMPVPFLNDFFPEDMDENETYQLVDKIVRDKELSTDDIQKIAKMRFVLEAYTN